MEPKFFKSEKELRQWFMKNHNKTKELWIGLFKRSASKDGLNYKQVFDQALCFGWTGNVMKAIDYYTYAVKYLPRRAKGGWSSATKKRFLELKKLGLVHKAGLAAYESRDDSKYQHYENPKFSPKYLKTFKANQIAWTFWESQTASYKKYMTGWVMGAKRQETRDKRFADLLRDSNKQQKLQRVLDAQEKFNAKNKLKHPPGKTPIEEGRNVGPMTGTELRSVGVDTVEKFKQMGWERVFRMLVQHYPNRLNLNMATGLIALEQDQDWRKLDPDLKAEAKALILDMKRDLR